MRLCHVTHYQVRRNKFLKLRHTTMRNAYNEEARSNIYGIKIDTALSAELEVQDVKQQQRSVSFYILNPAQSYQDLICPYSTLRSSWETDFSCLTNTECCQCSISSAQYIMKQVSPTVETIFAPMSTPTSIASGITTKPTTRNIAGMGNDVHTIINA